MFGFAQYNPWRGSSLRLKGKGGKAVSARDFSSAFASLPCEFAIYELILGSLSFLLSVHYLRRASPDDQRNGVERIILRLPADSIIVTSESSCVTPNKVHYAVCIALGTTRSTPWTAILGLVGGHADFCNSTITQTVHQTVPVKRRGTVSDRRRGAKKLLIKIANLA